MRVIDKPFLRILLQRGGSKPFDLSATNNAVPSDAQLYAERPTAEEGMNIENKTNLDHPRETEASERRFATEEVKRCAHSVRQPWD
jgi:hypothetical protein